MSAIFIMIMYPMRARHGGVSQDVRALRLGVERLDEVRLEHPQPMYTTNGSDVSTRAENFGSAVSVSTSPRNATRSRMSVREVGQHLAQVAARLALHEQRGDEHARVDRSDALLETQQGRAHVDAEALLVVEAGELRPQRRGDLLADELHRGLERVAGLEGVYEHVESFGELGLESLYTLGLGTPE
jgi:hypothetical protein